MSDKTLLVASLLRQAERYPGYAFCGFCGAFIEDAQVHRGRTCVRRSDTPSWVIEAWEAVAGLIRPEQCQEGA